MIKNSAVMKIGYQSFYTIQEMREMKLKELLCA